MHAPHESDYLVVTQQHSGWTVEGSLEKNMGKFDTWPNSCSKLRMRLRRETICNCCLISVELTNGIQNHLGWGTKSTEAADVPIQVRKQGSR
jgi:hypothetical protein